jgi:hypothetical protein
MPSGAILLSVIVGGKEQSRSRFLSAPLNDRTSHPSVTAYNLDLKDYARPPGIYSYLLEGKTAPACCDAARAVMGTFRVSKVPLLP